MVLFAPLYLSNHCVNGCLYCGFRNSGDKTVRRSLTVDEAVSQADYLAGRGFRRLLIVVGEHPVHGGVDYLAEVARAIYSRTEMRILHVNCAPLDTGDFVRLKQAGYGVYQCFQETYHRETYARMHPTGRKKDYDYRLAAMDRALEAGFGDVGIGALLGLYDHRYDALATIAHSRHLEDAFGAAAHTVSVPRLNHAEGSALESPPHVVTDDDFRKVVAVYRLCLPYTGVVVSTREPASLRDRVMLEGASQISAGSSTEPGGYGTDEKSASQFDVTDGRGLEEMVRVIAEKGLLPSLCTSCYRAGRQGDNYLHAAKGGAIRDFCTPNAILSLKEFGHTTGDAGLKKLCDDLVAKYTEDVDGPLRKDLVNKLAEIEAGSADLRY
jgi:2-iminoacetate synthase